MRLTAVQPDYRCLLTPYARYDWANEEAKAGVKLLPEFSSQWKLSKILELQSETALYLTAGADISDSTETFQDINLYRAWLRFGSAQTGLRIGKQKISFGSARILRPLQWFDELDPLDKSEYTDGVWAMQFSHTRLNNSSLSIWVKANPFSYRLSEEHDYGGRVQIVNPAGETAVSVDAKRSLAERNSYKLGFDHRWDGIFGAWIEAGVSRQGLKENSVKYSTAITLGADYTLPVGSGLALCLENELLHEGTAEPEMLHYSNDLVAVLASYPLGILDSITLLTIYEAGHNTNSGQLVWRRAYDKLSWDLGLEFDSGFSKGMFRNPTFSLKIDYYLF